MTYEVEIIPVAARTVAVTTFHVAASELPTIGERMGAAFGTVISQLARVGVRVHGPAVAIYDPVDDGFDVSAGFEVDRRIDPGAAVETRVLPAGEVAHVTHIGPYDRLGEAYDALRKGVAALGRQIDEAGTMWEAYWTGPEVPPEEQQTEIYWPLVA